MRRRYRDARARPYELGLRPSMHCLRQLSRDNIYRAP